MKIEGKVFCFKDNVNTDEIIPARYLSNSDPLKLAEYCMEDLIPGFGKREDIKGSIIVAGENFGSGSSREHAPISIKYAGIGCIVAKSFARIFLRNAINIGLPVVELKFNNEFVEGDRIRVDFKKGEIYNSSSEKTYKINPYPDFMQMIIESGGWINYLKNSSRRKS